MRTKDIEAVGELLGEASEATGTLVEDTHAAIAKRTFDALGPSAEPVRAMHDGISKAVYRGVRVGLRAASKHGSRAMARRAARTEHPGTAPLTDSPAGAAVAGAINGIWGDYLVERGSELALGMELRVGGAAIPVTPTSLAAAFPDATARVAVFLHGLCETDEAWKGLPPRGDAVRPAPYGERLRDDLDFTPLYVRFNSGLRISANGRALAALLTSVAEAWPTEIDEIVLVGHSMGGLVARSACHYGEVDHPSWAGAVRHVFCLGTPHLGADLEKGVHLLDWALAKAPETKPIAGALRRRSVGVKDLRFGAVAEIDWDGHDPDEFLRDRCQEVPFLDGVHYYFVGAKMSGVLGHALGDLLVRSPSASGRGKHRSVPFEIDNGHELPGLTHFHLLNHPDVYAQIRRWIERAGFRAAGVSA